MESYIDEIVKNMIVRILEKSSVDNVMDELNNYLFNHYCEKKYLSECEPEYCRYRYTDSCRYMKAIREIMKEYKINPRR